MAFQNVTEVSNTAKKMGGTAAGRVKGVIKADGPASYTTNGELMELGPELGWDGTVDDVEVEVIGTGDSKVDKAEFDYANSKVKCYRYNNATPPVLTEVVAATDLSNVKFRFRASAPSR